MRRPLVPVDGSASAKRALQHALAQLHGRDGVRLHLLNVQLPPLHTCPSKLVSPDLILNKLSIRRSVFIGPSRPVGL